MKYKIISLIFFIFSFIIVNCCFALKDSTNYNNRLGKTFNKGDFYLSIFGGYPLMTANVYDNFKSGLGPVIASAQYCIRNGLTFGLVYAYTRSTSVTANIVNAYSGQYLYSFSQKEQDNYFMAKMEFAWMNKRKYALYSGLGIGYANFYLLTNVTNGGTPEMFTNGLYQNSKYFDGTNKNGPLLTSIFGPLLTGDANYNANHSRLMQINLIGIKYEPVKNLTGFLDLGVGALGYINFGLQYTVYHKYQAKYE